MFNFKTHAIFIIIINLFAFNLLMSINTDLNGEDAGRCPGAPKLEPMCATDLQVEVLYLEEPSILDLKSLIKDVLTNYESINLDYAIQAAAICMQNQTKQYHALCLFELLLHKNIGLKEAIVAAQKAQQNEMTYDGGLALNRIIIKQIVECNQKYN